MASTVDIVNIALTLLGESRITSIDDDVKAAREAKALFDHARDALIGGYNWSFAKARAQLSADATAPVFEYANAFTLPVDCLRIHMAGEFYVGLDLTDYRGAPVEEFVIARHPLPLVSADDD